jgi:hypothetical protein
VENRHLIGTDHPPLVSSGGVARRKGGGINSVNPLG